MGLPGPRGVGHRGGQSVFFDAGRFTVPADRGEIFARLRMQTAKNVAGFIADRMGADA